MSTDFPAFYPAYKDRVEKALDRVLPPPDEKPTRLHDSMRYSTLNGGKRIRGVLVFLAGELGDPSSQEALENLAAVMEIIHAYSLVHDDLPAMDDDDFRRGKPTCHQKYGEATAILCGDALLTLALEVVANLVNLDADPKTVTDLMQATTHASSSREVIGGQFCDLDLDSRAAGDKIRSMYEKKTGSLIGLSLYLGGRTADLPESDLSTLQTCGRNIGVAFQIRDDLLEVTGDFEEIGKDVDSDDNAGKATYPKQVGLDQARSDSETLIKNAQETLRELPYDTHRLEQLASLVIQRTH